MRPAQNQPMNSAPRMAAKKRPLPEQSPCEAAPTPTVEWHHEPKVTPDTLSLIDLLAADCVTPAPPVGRRKKGISGMSTASRPAATEYNEITSLFGHH